MLNELLIVERGTRQAGFEVNQRHQDLKEAGGKLTLIVQLDEKGNVACVRTVPHRVKPWTLRDGQQNSFPFVQPKNPLWDFPDGDEARKEVLEKNKDDRRKALLKQGEVAKFNSKGFKNWPGNKMLGRLRERQQQLADLENTNASVVLSTFNRFLLACDLKVGGGPQRLLGDVVNKLVENLDQTAQEDLVKTAMALLIGKKEKKKDKWVCDGALLFEAAGYSLSIVDQRLIAPVSKSLQICKEDDTQNHKAGVCGLTGLRSKLFTGNFPQPNLPGGLGQTYLFSKNKEIPANDRYGRFSCDAMPVGEEMVIRLDGAIRALTCESRRNKTWRPIPGEAPKQRDLLLAFIEKAPDAPVAALLAENDAEKDFSGEESNAVPEATESVAAFEKRTERLIQAVQAKVTDFRNTPVQLVVLRKLDPANRKVIYAGAPTVTELYQAATTWVAGERNMPPWLALPVLQKGESKPRQMGPPHVAPLELIAFSKKVFIRGGTEAQEVVGLPTSEALRFFLDPSRNGNLLANRRVKRMLRLVLGRRATLITGTGQALRCGFDFAKGYDCHEALKTVTFLGILLHKLGRNKEVYMNEAAFKFGQLLAAADVVHAGYCADVRGGDIPPSLLGNQIFPMAQSSPTKALATLCRRWKPYDGWAKKAARDPNRAQLLIESQKKGEQQRGWDIKRALRHAREMGPLAAELAPALEDCHLDNVFLAELLLGYIAGLPKTQKEDFDVQEPNQNEKEED